MKSEVLSRAVPGRIRALVLVLWQFEAVEFLISAVEESYLVVIGLTEKKSQIHKKTPSPS